jgi:hypothetical protein
VRGSERSYGFLLRSARVRGPETGTPLPPSTRRRAPRRSLRTRAARDRPCPTPRAHTAQGFEGHAIARTSAPLVLRREQEKSRPTLLLIVPRGSRRERGSDACSRAEARAREFRLAPRDRHTSANHPCGTPRRRSAAKSCSGPCLCRYRFGVRDGHPDAVPWSRCPLVSLPIVSETMASFHTRDTRSGRGGSPPAPARRCRRLSPARPGGPRPGRA